MTSPDGAEFPNVSARALADLARAGYSTLRQPSRLVDFQVRHSRDRPGILFDLAAQPSADHLVETVSTSAFGIGVVIGTNVGASGLGPALDRPIMVQSSSPDEVVFVGRARPNITFLYESHHVLEGIAVIEDEPRRLGLRHGMAVRDLVECLADVAANFADAPLLSVQCPVQVPSNTYSTSAQGGTFDQDLEPLDRQSKPPRAALLAVRFAIATDDPSVAAAFRLTSRITKYCNEKGLGLWIADTRPGNRTGNWFSIRAHERKLARDSYPNWTDAHHNNAFEGCIPVTFVGPARTGSTHAILAFLKEIHGVSVVACSIASLDDLALIHLQLAIHGSSRNRRVELNDALRAMRSTPGSLIDRIQALMPFIAVDGAILPSANAGSRLLAKAGDYQAMIGDAYPALHDHNSKRVALWLSWQMHRSSRGLELPLATLSEALAMLGFVRPEGVDPALAVEYPNFDYMICRDVGGSFLRGKAKLSIPEAAVDRAFRAQGPDLPITQFAMQLEQAWKVTANASSGSGTMSDVTVSWHEYWLGHWSTPF